MKLSPRWMPLIRVLLWSGVLKQLPPEPTQPFLPIRSMADVAAVGALFGDPTTGKA